MLRAAVPEAAVNEHGHASGGENKISSEAFIWQRTAGHSVAEAKAVHRSTNLHLGPCIALAITPHYAANARGRSRRSLRRERIGNCQFHCTRHLCHSSHPGGRPAGSTETSPRPRVATFVAPRAILRPIVYVPRKGETPHLRGFREIAGKGSEPATFGL